MANLNKKAFQKRYLDVFTGSLSYSFVNSFPSNTTKFSLYLDAIPTIDSTRQILFSVGNAGASILFEVGINATNKVFVYDGSTEFDVGEALVSGTSYNITVVYGNSSLTVYINDNMYFTGLDIAAIEGLDIVIGESILTSDFYKGYLKDVILFASEHSSKTVGTITNIEFFKPSDITNLAAWYEARDVDYILTPAAQTDQNLYDWDMEESGTGAWIPNACTITKETLAPTSQQGGQYIKLVSTAGDCYISQFNKFIAGNRYIVDILCKMPIGYASSHPYGLFDVGAVALPEWTRVTQEHTWDATYFYPLSRGIVTGEYGLWDDQRTNNISRTEWYPSAGSIGGKLKQSTAIYQPWWNASAFSNKGSVRGVGDQLIDNNAASSWINASNGEGFSFAMPFNSDSSAGMIWSTAGVNNALIGTTLYKRTSGVISIYVGNGSGIDYAIALLSATGVVADDTDCIVSGQIANGTDGVKLRINGVEVATGTLVSPSTSSPVLPMQLLAQTGVGFPLTGDLGDCIFVNSVWSDADRDNTEAYLSTKYKVVLG